MVEGNRGYFRTQYTRKTCLGGIFVVQKTPGGNIFFADSALQKLHVAEQNRGTRDTGQLFTDFASLTEMPPGPLGLYV